MNFGGAQAGAGGAVQWGAQQGGRGVLGECGECSGGWGAARGGAGGMAQGGAVEEGTGTAAVSSPQPQPGAGTARRWNPNQP